MYIQNAMEAHEAKYLKKARVKKFCGTGTWSDQERQAGEEGEKKEGGKGGKGK